MNVPYLFLKEQNNELREKLEAAFSAVLDTSYFIMGNEVKSIEESIAKYCGTKHAIGVNSGTDALLLPLLASNIGSGDEVITVSNSFFATGNVIALLGARPVFVDVKEDLLIDETAIEAAITNKTKAIIPVHLTGKPCNMPVIMEIAERHDLLVIEDAAQAIGAKIDGQPVGSFGVGAFSFHPLKNLSACGDGGIITVDDTVMYEKIRLLQNHGLRDREHIGLPGLNSRLDEVQAALLNVKFEQLDWITERRRANADLYFELFNDLQCDDILYVPYDDSNEFSVYHTFVIRVNRRDELQEFLAKQGIETKIHYSIPIHLQEPYTDVTWTLPNTVAYAKQILSLPIHQYLSEEQIRYVVKTISEFYSS